MTPLRICRALSALAAGLLSVAAAPAADWPSAGRDLKNTRYQADEARISPATVGGLRLRWSFATAGDVTANPALDADHLYFPDSGGWLYKVHRKTGALAWKVRVGDLTGIPGDFARASPALAGKLLILGNQAGKLTDPQGAVVVGVDKTSGQLLWRTRIDGPIDAASANAGWRQRYSFITHSAIVADGQAIVGLASNEELVAGFWPRAAGWTWNFRGSVVSLDVATGAVRWRTYLVPEGYSGGAVWGSTGAVDRQRRRVYMATGNHYSVPDAVLACLNGGGTPAGCIAPDNHIDSIVAMDLDTGAIVWGAKGLPYDAWNVGCGLDIPGVISIAPNDNCPNPKGPDWDFAQGPMLFGGPGAAATDAALVGAGQKSGWFWAFRAADGQPAWATQVAPPGLTGGLQWGSASDGRRLYVDRLGHPARRLDAEGRLDHHRGRLGGAGRRHRRAGLDHPRPVGQPGRGGRQRRQRRHLRLQPRPGERHDVRDGRPRRPHPVVAPQRQRAQPLRQRRVRRLQRRAVDRRRHGLLGHRRLPGRAGAEEAAGLRPLIGRCRAVLPVRRPGAALSARCCRWSRCWWPARSCSRCARRP